MEVLPIKNMHTRGRKHDGYFVRVTQIEATSLICSLAEQLRNNNPNTSRLESYTDKGEYFTIAVIPEPSGQMCMSCGKHFDKPSYCQECVDNAIYVGKIWRKSDEKRRPTKRLKGAKK